MNEQVKKAMWRLADKRDSGEQLTAQERGDLDRWEAQWIEEDGQQEFRRWNPRP